MYWFTTGLGKAELTFEGESLEVITSISGEAALVGVDLVGVMVRLEGLTTSTFR